MHHLKNTILPFYRINKYEVHIRSLKELDKYLTTRCSACTLKDDDLT